MPYPLPEYISGGEFTDLECCDGIIMADIKSAKPGPPITDRIAIGKCPHCNPEPGSDLPEGVETRLATVEVGKLVVVNVFQQGIQVDVGKK